MVKTLLPVETLVKYMESNGCSVKDIAELTDSAIRSVQRWVKSGIPKTKWTVLKLKEGKKK